MFHNMAIVQVNGFRSISTHICMNFQQNQMNLHETRAMHSTKGQGSTQTPANGHKRTICWRFPKMGQWPCIISQSYETGSIIGLLP